MFNSKRRLQKLERLEAKINRTQDITVIFKVIGYSGEEFNRLEIPFCFKRQGKENQEPNK